MIDTLDTESQEITEPSSGGSDEILEQKAEQPSVLDLDSVDKFKFNGREWTPKDLKSAYMMQSDYTRKMQDISQDRKFADNLSYDVSKVLENPALADEFKKVYPQKYHAVLEKILERASPKTGTEGSRSPDDQMKKELAEIKAHINEQKAINHERQVLAAQAEIDSIFDSLQKKYEMADENLVVSYAQALLEKGQKLNKETYENLFKLSHETNQKRLEQFYSKKVGQQKKANSMAKDVGAGGGTLGQAPTQFKSIESATSALVREFNKQNN